VAAPGTPVELFDRGYAVSLRGGDVVGLGTSFRNTLESFQASKAVPIASVYG
jgi:hypothetical protein